MHHEQVFCQLCNFAVMSTVALALTSMRVKYPLGISINTMMCAINYLPGQV